MHFVARASKISGVIVKYCVIRNKHVINKGGGGGGEVNSPRQRCCCGELTSYQKDDIFIYHKCYFCFRNLSLFFVFGHFYIVTGYLTAKVVGNS